MKLKFRYFNSEIKQIFKFDIFSADFLRKEKEEFEAQGRLKEFLKLITSHAGFTDIVGNDVYEGDIVLLNNGDIDLIAWDSVNGMFCYESDKKNRERGVDEDDYCEYECDCNNQGFGKVLVIGNKFKNDQMDLDLCKIIEKNALDYSAMTLHAVRTELQKRAENKYKQKLGTKNTAQLINILQND